MVINDEIDELDDVDTNALCDLFVKAMALYNDNNFSLLDEIVTDTFLKREIDNYYDLQKRGLKEVVEKVNVSRVNRVANPIEGMLILELLATLEKYVLSIKDDEVVDGVREYIVEVKYEVKYEHNSIQKVETCKYCGAKLSDGESKCSYCGTPVHKKTSDWLVSDIKEIDKKDFHKEMMGEYKEYNDEQWKDLWKRINKPKKF